MPSIMNLPWQNFKNESGEEIPPFAVLKITGAVLENGMLLLTADKPDEYGSQFSHYVSGPVRTRAGGKGICLPAERPTWAAYDGAGPQAGETWGPVEDSWLLHKHVGGFRIVGHPVQGRVLVIRQPMLFVIGKTTIAHDKGEFEPIAIWHGEHGNEVDSTYEFESVHNRWADLPDETWVGVTIYSDGRKELTVAECPDEEED